MKVCKKCGKLKDKSEFHKSINKSGSSRFSNSCIVCLGKEENGAKLKDKDELKAEVSLNKPKIALVIFSRTSIMSKNNIHTVKAMIKNGLKIHEYKKEFNTFLKARNHVEDINKNPSIAENYLNESRLVRYNSNSKEGPFSAK